MDSTLNVKDAQISLKQIVSIAKDAGNAIMSIYNTPTDDWDIKSKSDDSPLTKADLTANALICKELSENYPAIPIMSEENKNAEYAQRAGWSLYWCVDPLDGTKEFVKRNGEFTVNIALMSVVPGADDGSARPVLGVVHAPVLGVTYYAADGIGAFRCKAETGKEETMSVKQFSESDERLTLVCSRSHLDERTQQFIDKFSNPSTKSMGSSLKFMLVADGDAHIYPRLAPTMEWDTAASQIIVEEAGGEVINSETVKPLRYNKEDLTNPYFCVYGKRTS